MVTMTRDDYIKTMAQNELSRRMYSEYLIRVHHGMYKPLRHTQYLAERLQAIADGEQKHIIVEMPPRHSKSMTITETFPSYFIGRNPHKRVIATAYSEGLARKFGRLNRNKLVEFGADIFGISMANDNSTATNWSVGDNVGGMVSTGIGGSITGEGADLLIIDDPIKNNAEAQSETIRNKIWDEWESTLSTRLHKGASVIVVMTRWHEDDIVGRLLERSPYNWERIRMPAIAEDEDDLLGREVGEALSKELGFDEDWATLKKQEVGSKTWNALYQQRPSASEGNIFKREWWQYYERAPRKFDKIIISWDLTFKGNESNDYVVGQVWLKKGADKYLIDVVREQMDFPETLEAVKALARKYPKAKEILIEDKANGPAVISSIKREVSGIIPIKPRGSKVARAQAITPQIESGNVFLPKYTRFVDDLIEECASFPSGANDDQVDALSQALDRLASERKAVASNVNLF